MSDDILDLFAGKYKPANPYSTSSTAQKTKKPEAKKETKPPEYKAPVEMMSQVSRRFSFFHGD
jgi:hypothetical protein